MKPYRLNWQSSEVASKWPEGSVVLEVRPNLRTGAPVWQSLDIHRYHRPDWLTKGHPNYQKHLAHYLYCLLELP